MVKKAKTRNDSTTAAKKVGRAMKKRQGGTLKSGRSGKTVTSRKQAIAIGLSEARKTGAKVPKTKNITTSKTSAKKKKTKQTSAKRKAKK